MALCEGASTDQRCLNFSLLNRIVSSSVGRKLDLSNLRIFSRCSNLLCSLVTCSDESDMLNMQTLDVFSDEYIRDQRASNLLVNVLVCHAQNLSQGLHQLIRMGTSYGCSEVQLRAYLSTQQH